MPDIRTSSESLMVIYSGVRHISRELQYIYRHDRAWWLYEFMEIQGNRTSQQGPQQDPQQVTWSFLKLSQIELQCTLQTHSNTWSASAVEAVYTKFGIKFYTWNTKLYPWIQSVHCMCTPVRSGYSLISLITFRESFYGNMQERIRLNTSEASNRY